MKVTKTVFIERMFYYHCSDVVEILIFCVEMLAQCLAEFQTADYICTRYSICVNWLKFCSDHQYIIVQVFCEHFKC